MEIASPRRRGKPSKKRAGGGGSGGGTTVQRRAVFNITGTDFSRDHIRNLFAQINEVRATER